jgi:hypothetical protein
MKLDLVVALVDLEHHHGSLGVDAAELIALVRVALAIEGPRMARAHQLVGGDVALTEVVVEMRAKPRRGADAPVVISPHHELLTVNVDRNDPTAHYSVACDAHSRLTGELAHDACAVVE